MSTSIVPGRILGESEPVAGGLIHWPGLALILEAKLEPASEGPPVARAPANQCHRRAVNHGQ